MPPMVAISIGAGGQDAQGSERGLEYDAVNGAYAEFVENEVLPLAERHANVKLTKNPDGRATMGISSSGAAAFTMAWFHPELYHRVLAYSPTVVNQQWPHNPALPGGAWEYHSAWAGPPVANLGVEGAKVAKSGYALRFAAHPQQPDEADPHLVRDRRPAISSTPSTPVADGMHDWVLADERFAKVLADKGYHYQFLFARNAQHVDKATVAQTLAGGARMAVARISGAIAAHVIGVGPSLVGRVRHRGFALVDEFADRLVLRRVERRGFVFGQHRLP